MGRIIKFVKEHKIIVIEVSIVALVFACTLLLNFLTEFASDDWCYTFLYDNCGYPAAEGVKRIQSFTDLLLSTRNHWLQWSGRVVPHFLLQGVLTTTYPGAWHKVVFNFINAGMYAALGVVIYRFVICRKERRPFLLMLIYILMWFFLPEYGSTVLWASGAANYLWMTVIQLLFLLPYRKYGAEGEPVKKDNIKNACLMALFGAICGCTTENAGCAVFFLSVLFILYYKIQKIKIPKWSVMGAAGALAGFIVLLISPGYRRETGLNYVEKLSLRSYFDALKNIFADSAGLFFGLVMLLAIVLIAVMLTGNGKKDFAIREVSLSIILLLGAMCAVGVLLVGNRAPDRAYFFPASLIIVTICLLFARIDISGLSKIWASGLTAVLIVVTGISFNSAVQDISMSYREVEARRAIIAEAVETGDLDVRIGAIPRTQNPHNINYEPAWIIQPCDNPADWGNVWPAAYYGLDRLVAE